MIATGNDEKNEYGQNLIMVSHFLRIRDRAVIEFGYFLDFTAPHLHAITKLAFGDQGPSLSHIYKCFNELDAGTFRLVSRPPAGRSIHEEDILRVEKIVQENPSMSIRGIAETANLSRYSVRVILQ